MVYNKGISKQDLFALASLLLFWWRKKHDFSFYFERCDDVVRLWSDYMSFFHSLFYYFEWVLCKLMRPTNGQLCLISILCGKSCSQQFEQTRMYVYWLLLLLDFFFQRDVQTIDCLSKRFIIDRTMHYMLFRHLISMCRSSKKVSFMCIRSERGPRRWTNTSVFFFSTNIGAIVVIRCARFKITTNERTIQNWSERCKYPVKIRNIKVIEPIPTVE